MYSRRLLCVFSRWSRSSSAFHLFACVLLLPCTCFVTAVRLSLLCSSSLSSPREVHLDNISRYFAVDVRFDGEMRNETTTATKKKEKQKSLKPKNADAMCAHNAHHVFTVAVAVVVVVSSGSLVRFSCSFSFQFNSIMWTLCCVIQCRIRWQRDVMLCVHWIDAVTSDTHTLKQALLHKIHR